MTKKRDRHEPVIVRAVTLRSPRGCGELILAEQRVRQLALATTRRRAKKRSPRSRRWGQARRRRQVSVIRALTRGVLGTPQVKPRGQ
jgi:hypothetical protein